MLRVALRAVGFCLVVAAFARAADRPPVLAYDFGRRLPGAVPDCVGDHHATIHGQAKYVDSPTGTAFVFDGATTLVTPPSADLGFKRELTLDFWLRLDKLGERYCLIDKSSDRYRLFVNPDGSIHFALKGEGKRVDLTVRKLTAGKWHRVTATFKRPVLTVYIDGKKVGLAKWDHDVGVGRDLVIGAWARRHTRFKGAIDRVRLYDYARAPRPEDDKQVFGGGAAVKARLAVKRSGDVTQVDTGPMQFELDHRTGAVRSLVVDGKKVIADNAAPPLFGEVMESADYDGVRDLTKRTFTPARYRCDSVSARPQGDRFHAEVRGVLDFGRGDAADFRLTYEAPKGARRLKLNLTLTKRGAFRNRFLRRIGLRQPLALDPRKRITQAGDQGLRWTTRHHYQYHMHVRFMPQPDHNWWRHFYVDQRSDHSYAVWRAESENTSALCPFHGKQAAGWMSVYDRHGGALFAYRGLARRAPKCLYVNADGGGEGVVYLHAPTHAAMAPDDPRLGPTVFGKPHEIDWLFFKGQEAFEQPDRRLAQVWGVKQLPSDSPDRFDPVDNRLAWRGAPAAAGDHAPLVCGGLPVPRGALRDAAKARVFVRGREAALQADPIAYWPDGSIKWLLLTFPLEPKSQGFQPGSGEGNETAFQVTLRKGAPVPCSLRFGEGVRAARVAASIRVTRTDDRVTLDTGPLTLTLSRGERWMPSAAVNGREMIRREQAPQAVVDFLRTPKDPPVGCTHPEGTPDPGPVRIEKIQVEQAGPLRAVVRLEGRALCKEPPRVILRVEVLAGRPWVRLSHTVEFTHKDPRRVFLRRMAVRLPLNLNRARRVTAGGQKGPVEIPHGAAAGLTQSSHMNYEIWGRNDRTPFREVRDSAHRSRGWLDASGDAGGVAAVERFMWQESPKALVVRDDPPALEIEYWPESERLMDVRRYSNYPHRGQGESTPCNPRWVLDTYYPNDPFVGVTKTHETLIYFHGPGVTPGQIDAVAADFHSRPLVYAGWKTYADARITLPQTDPASEAWAGSSRCLADLAEWWLFQQRAWGWYGMWDFGDVRHLYRRGYGRIFAPDKLKGILARPARERLKINIRKLGWRYDYYPTNDWAFDNGRWGWSNTEGLPNLFMQYAYLRSGRRDLFFFIEANARHVRDVDARHSGKWFGRGTRHGVQHWSDGNHEPRQTTFTEQRFHYLLSGDPRTREWNRDLTERSYTKGVCSVHAHHSGRLYGILTRWELTGDPKLTEVMRRYVAAFARPEGIDVSPTVAFPGPRLVKTKEMNGGTMFFHNFGGMHALLEYYYLTGDERLRDSLIKMADFAVAKGGRRAAGLYRKAVAFAAVHAPDGEKYRKALREWAADRGARYVFQMVAHNRAHWTGPASFLTGNVPGGMFWAMDAAYVLQALGADPKLSASAKATIKQYEERPVQLRRRLPRTSWQTEYDRPEFRGYLEDRLAKWKPGM